MDERTHIWTFFLFLILFLLFIAAMMLRFKTREIMKTEKKMNEEGEVPRLDQYIANFKSRQIRK